MAQAIAVASAMPGGGGGQKQATTAQPYAILGRKIKRKGGNHNNMPAKLKELKITSTDLVEQGANPDANIRLYKRKDAESGEMAETYLQKAITALRGVFGKTGAGQPLPPIKKDAATFDESIERERQRRVTDQIWAYAYALRESLESIATDSEQTSDEKAGLMGASLNEFVGAVRSAIPKWSSSKEVVAMEPENGPESEKEETENMKIDKNKLTPEERSTLEAIEKKYGLVGDPQEGVESGDGSTVAKSTEEAVPVEGAEAVPAMHPEVKKALDDNKKLTAQLEAMQKSLDIKDLTAIAKKYEAIGKNAEELAPKLYELKKAGGTAYDDYVGLLDEQVTLVEKGGLFAEYGTSRSGVLGKGSEIGAKAAEVKKANTEMTSPEAIVKAYEDNPELAAQYEAEYNKGR